MGPEDLLEQEVGVAVGATALIISPRAREVARKGAVYGLAGILKAGDAAASLARGTARGVQSGATRVTGSSDGSGSGSGSRSRSSSRSRSTARRSTGGNGRGSGSGSRSRSSS